MFGAKKKQYNYDKETQTPVIRISICTGERVAGFQNKATGKFTDVMLIKREADLNEFCRQYGVKREEIGKIY